MQPIGLKRKGNSELILFATPERPPHHESHEKRLLDQFEALGDLQSDLHPLSRHHQHHSLPLLFDPTDKQMQAAIVEDAEGDDITWEQLTTTGLEDVWDVTRTSASAAQDIGQGFR
ncbi:hypothetical protein PIB30_041765 [Stylosanthes scabra]|uniref:Uncharacterized protein n=1 Tax=Stylosanthes scabra TaxID=79078 RepID=A0ABU6SGC0_9FABA|nr:hypothetical protein [Stylosanthes scabra]